LFGGPNYDRQVFVPITTYNKGLANDRGNKPILISPLKAPLLMSMEDWRLNIEVIGEMRQIVVLKAN